MTDENATSLQALLDKGEGVLVKRGHVWTFPGCANDPSGTNLVLPTEFVSDVDVREALSAGDLRAAITNPDGSVAAVRAIDDETPVMTSGMAGSPEMGTELPANARVEADAGALPITSAEAEQQVLDAMAPTSSEPEKKPAKAKS